MATKSVEETPQPVPESAGAYQLPPEVSLLETALAAQNGPYHIRR